jgi:hypothetical protein
MSGTIARCPPLNAPGFFGAVIGHSRLDLYSASIFAIRELAGNDFLNRVSFNTAFEQRQTLFRPVAWTPAEPGSRSGPSRTGEGTNYTTHGGGFRDPSVKSIRIYRRSRRRYLAVPPGIPRKSKPSSRLIAHHHAMERRLIFWIE